MKHLNFGGMSQGELRALMQQPDEDPVDWALRLTSAGWNINGICLLAAAQLTPDEKAAMRSANGDALNYGTPYTRGEIPFVIRAEL